MRISGKKLKEYREAAGLTASELAQSLDVSGQALSYHENKDSSRMSLLMVAAIAERLNIKVSDLAWK